MISQIGSDTVVGCTIIQIDKGVADAGPFFIMRYVGPAKGPFPIEKKIMKVAGKKSPHLSPIFQFEHY